LIGSTQAMLKRLRGWSAARATRESAAVTHRRKTPRADALGRGGVFTGRGKGWRGRRHAFAQTTRARRSPLVKAVTCPYTLSTYIHEFGNLGLLAQAGDRRLAVRAITEAARGAGDVPRTLINCLDSGS